MAENENSLIIRIDAQQARQDAEQSARSVKKLEDAGTKASKSTDNLGKQSKKTAKEVKGFGKNTDSAADSVNQLNSMMGTLTGVMAGVGFGAMIKGSYDTAAQLDLLSDRLNISVEQLSRNSEAAKAHGIDLNDLADVYKDVNDRIGDFSQTTGGPLADFFEQIGPAVGVTIEQFRALNGADALQLYIDSLEKANVSHDDFTFYLEGISSEAIRLLPLLRNGGAEMQRLGAQAEAAGATIDATFAANARAAQLEINHLSQQARGLSNEVAQTLVPVLSDSAKWFGENLETITQTVKIFGGLYLAIKTATTAQAAFNAVSRVNPWIAIGTAVGLATAAIYEYMGATERSIDNTLDMWERAATSSSAYEIAQNRINDSQRVYDELVQEQKEKQAELNELKDEGFKLWSRDGNRVRELEKEIAEIEAKRNELQDARIKADKAENERRKKAREEELAWQKRIEELRSQGITPNNIPDSDGEADKLASQIAKATSEYEKLLSVFDPVQSALKTHDQQLSNLELLLDQNEISVTEYTRALAQATSEYDEAVRAADPYLQSLDKLNEKYRKGSDLAKAFKEQQTALKSGDQFLIDQTTNSVNDTLTGGAPKVTPLDSQVAGPFSDLSRIESEREQLRAWQAEQLAMIQEFEEQKLITVQQSADAKLQIDRQALDATAQLERQAQLAKIDGYANTFGTIGELTAQFAGRGAKITKTLLAFEQGANLAKTAMNLATAQGNAAASLPFPANLAAMATVASQTVGLIGTIASIKQPDTPNFAGMYDKGGDIPAGHQGIVGEFGPELVTGPVSVTSRKETAAMAKQAMGKKSVTINYSPVFNIDGGSIDEQQLAQRNEAQFMQMLEREKRPGGALAS